MLPAFARVWIAQACLATPLVLVVDAEEGDGGAAVLQGLKRVLVVFVWVVPPVERRRERAPGSPCDVVAYWRRPM